MDDSKEGSTGDPDEMGNVAGGETGTVGWAAPRALNGFKTGVRCGFSSISARFEKKFRGTG